MFILTPLVLIVCSILGIAIIIWRKKSYIDKLSTLGNSGGAGTSSGNFSWKSYGEEFFPEFKVLLEKFKLYEQRSKWLMEAEKTLRRTRLVFLRVDRLSDSLIKKIRRVHVNNQLNVQTNSSTTPEIVKDSATHEVHQETKSISPVFLKNEEQRLIIEIAKNPKNPHLYEVLGDLYVEMGNYVDAKESFEAVLELNPGNQEAKKKLSSALEKLAQAN